MVRQSTNLILLMLMAALLGACPKQQQQQQASESKMPTAINVPLEEEVAPEVLNPGTVQALSPGLPELSLAMLDGSTKQLSDFKGKPLVVNFWAEW